MSALELPGRTPAPPKIVPTKIYETETQIAKPQPRYCKAVQRKGAGKCVLLPIKCRAYSIVAGSGGGSDKPSAIFGRAGLFKTSIFEEIYAAAMHKQGGKNCG